MVKNKHSFFFFIFFFFLIFFSQELLRRTAEHHLSEIIVLTFKRSFSETESVKKEKEKTNEKKLNKSLSLDVHLMQEQEVETTNQQNAKLENSNPNLPKNFVNFQGVHFEVSQKEKLLSGTPSYLLFLVSLLDPDNENSSDTIKLVSLNTVNLILELFHKQISSNQELIAVIKNQLCKNLFEVKIFY